MVIEQTLINGTHYKYLTEVNDEIVLVTLEKQTSGRFLNPSDVRTTVYVGKDHNDAVIKNFQFFNIPSGKQVFFQFITGQFVPLINAAGFPLVRVKRSKVAIRQIGNMVEFASQVLSDIMESFEFIKTINIVNYLLRTDFCTVKNSSLILLLLYYHQFD